MSDAKGLSEQIAALKEQAQRTVNEASTIADVDKARVQYLGKRGEVTGLLRGLGALPAEQRPEAGRLVNMLRDELTAMLESRSEQLQEAAHAARVESETIDVTMPGKRPAQGGLHPLTQVRHDIEDFFIGFGFEVVEGPEIETDYYNFEALNVPAHHPARDMQDTFYTTFGMPLRTQTSPVQVRTMENRVPPVRVIAPGKVYRVDSPDATHTPMFHQVEGLLIDTKITFGDLKGTLTELARHLFGAQRGVRFRPSYFPFTEPSAEMDIACGLCAGDGCRFCSYEGWIEILGAGMVHPNVLKMVGYDEEEVGGFAFGMGLERIALLKYGIDDIRVLFDGDIRLLRQFR